MYSWLWCHKHSHLKCLETRGQAGDWEDCLLFMLLYHSTLSVANHRPGFALDISHIFVVHLFPMGVYKSSMFETNSKNRKTDEKTYERKHTNNEWQTSYCYKVFWSNPKSTVLTEIHPNDSSILLYIWSGHGISSPYFPSWIDNWPWQKNVNSQNCLSLFTGQLHS